MKANFEDAVDKVLEFMGDKQKCEEIFKSVAMVGFRKEKKCYLCGKKRKVSHPWVVVRNTDNGPVIEFHTIQTCFKHSKPEKLVELKRSISSNGSQRGWGAFITAIAEGSDKFNIEFGEIGSDA